MLPVWTYTGTIAKPPEKQQVGQYSLTKLSMAVNYNQKGVELTEWYNINVWGQDAEKAALFSKGDVVCVTGELKHRQHETKTYNDINAKLVYRIRKAPETNLLTSGVNTSVSDEDVPF